MSWSQTSSPLPRKRKRSSNEGSGHDDHAASIAEADKQVEHEGSSRETSVSNTLNMDGTKRQRCIMSKRSSTLAKKGKKRSSEDQDLYVPTPDGEPRKRERSRFWREQGPEPQSTAIGESYNRSTFSSLVSTSTGTPTPEMARSKRKHYNEESGLTDTSVMVQGHEQECTPESGTGRSCQCPRIVTPNHDEHMRMKCRRSVDFGLEHEAPHGCDAENSERITDASELHASSTPISDILGTDAHCGPHTPPLTAKTAVCRRQKKLFYRPSNNTRLRLRDGAAAFEKEKRGWALDRRRKDLDHGKFTEDELISLNCGLNELQEARNWDRDEAVRILTHRSGRGRPHEEARGAWEEIGKQLPGSSIVRVNMKTRAFLFRGKTGRWDKEETDMLKRLVQEYDNDWITISSKLGRSNGACARKWASMRLDENRPRKRGKWTQDEYDNLCQCIREAKATMILNPCRRIGNRKVIDNLRWEPIALKMGRPANQCGAVWYNRLAPSMDKELCLSEEDRQWADEDDRRLLKKMLRLMSLHGEISWDNLFLRNRKHTTCKARFHQMTNPRCLGDLSEASVAEQLEVLVRRYAPDLVVKSTVKWNKGRNEIEDEKKSDGGEHCRVRHQGGFLKEFEAKDTAGEESNDVRLEYTSRMDARGDMPTRHEFQEEQEMSMNQSTEETVESPIRRNLDEECEVSENHLRDGDPSESSCAREVGSVDIRRCEGQPHDRNEECSGISFEEEKKGDSSNCIRGGIMELPPYLERTEECSTTSRRHVTGRLDERNFTELMNQVRHKPWAKNIEMYRDCSAENGHLHALEYRMSDAHCQESVVEHKSEEGSRKLSDICLQNEDAGYLLTENEDSCSEDEGSTSSEF